MSDDGHSEDTGSPERRGGKIIVIWERWQPCRGYWKLIGAGIFVGGYLVLRNLVF